jgi:3-deoxy-manno-octulosonate cytidylyltransferase (CMP-KDO synthetase)
MTNTAIIIPSRLNAQRLPNKPLKLIKNKEMILHVHDQAVNAKIGEVIIATPDKEIFDLIKKHGGKAVITEKTHQTGTDRIFEVFEKTLNKKPDIIINLQGDMPNLNPKAIKELTNHMINKTCDIATLASNIDLKKKELEDPNICKVNTNKKISNGEFATALDFYRIIEKKKTDCLYHHIGIYAFTNEALIRYVGLKRSKLEVERKLEQLRALENKMKIEVGFINACPLSVDTESDLLEIRKILES